MMMNVFDTGFKEDFNYILSTIGESITINDKDAKLALITKGDNKDKLINYKNIATNYSINTGDIVKYRDKLWIILSEVNESKNTYKSMIRRLDHIIKIYVNNILHEIPCIIESANNGIKEGKYIIVGDGNLKITVQDSTITDKIHEDMRIIKWGYAWKVIAKSRENKGLTYIYFEKDATSTYDDTENEIADRWQHEVKHNYSIELTSTEININKGNMEQLNVTVKDTTDSCTVVVENPTIMYISNNIDIATVDEKGLITAINEGNTTITVKFENVEKVINVTVSNVVELLITGRDTMTLDRIREYTSNIPVSWSVEDVNNTTGKPWTSITSQTDTSVTVKTTSDWIFNDDSCKYFNIIAVDKNNSSNMVKKKIEITAY